jgi:hypothetical protein
MTNKKPWKVGPSMGGRQAYVYEDANGVSWIRQSLRTEDGRVLWFDMTPGECTSLQADLESARMDILSDLWATPGKTSDSDNDRPEARF